MKDLFGQAILDFQTGNNPENLITETTISEKDELSVSYLFRNYEDMPIIEQFALDQSCGTVLDLGCGAGSHSLFLQDSRKLSVTSIDISENAIAACRLRGLKNAIVSDIMDFKGMQFDTILLLMNGAGMCGKLERVPEFLEKLKLLIKPGGQILLDSSDIIYMFDEDEDGGKWIPGERYYGEVEFNISYKGQDESPFDWLYIDFDTLQEQARLCGMQCIMLKEGLHYDYLAKLYI
jgi:SAM-dependent methyltransferase